MSGILDSKTRLMDTTLTLEGRRQLAEGGLKISFVSFTDAEAFYEADVTSGSTDAGDRISLEAASLPQDRVTFAAGTGGRLSSYPGAALVSADGKVINVGTGQVTGSDFFSAAEELLGSSIDNFTRLYAIRTRDAIFDDDTEFSITPNSTRFSVTTNSPLGDNEVKLTTVDRVEAVFQDKRLSHLPNFLYLPPINKVSKGDTSVRPLGQYPVIGQRTTPLTYEQIASDISKKDQSIVQFSQTTLRSNVTCQFFEVKQDIMHKLDVIDFGEVITTDPDFPTKHVFFVGKLFIDARGAQTFVNVFTLVFE